MNNIFFVSMQCLQTGILLNCFLAYFNGIIYTYGLPTEMRGVGGEV